MNTYQFTQSPRMVQTTYLQIEQSKWLSLSTEETLLSFFLHAQRKTKRPSLPPSLGIEENMLEAPSSSGMAEIFLEDVVYVFSHSFEKLDIAKTILAFVDNTGGLSIPLADISKQSQLPYSYDLWEQVWQEMQNQWFFFHDSRETLEEHMFALLDTWAKQEKNLSLLPEWKEYQSLKKSNQYFVFHVKQFLTHLSLSKQDQADLENRFLEICQNVFQVASKLVDQGEAEKEIQVDVVLKSTKDAGIEMTFPALQKEEQWALVFHQQKITVQENGEEVDSSFFQYRLNITKKILSFVIYYQQEYLQGKREFILPLEKRLVSEIVGCDPSVVSRVLKDKFYAKDGQIYSFETLFSGKAGFKGEKEVLLPVEIQKRIQSYVLEEDKDHPLTDLEITQLLQNEGVWIQRRTVQKYRQLLGIPDSRKRKRDKNKFS